jgi:integrase
MFSLSKSEIRQVLEVIDLDSPFGRRDYLLILFLFHTGLRVGECSGLIIPSSTVVDTENGRKGR